MDEIRLAMRRLRYRPAATLASILTLGCAIGAAAATWSLITKVLLHPVPVDAARVFVAEARPSSSRFAGVRRDGWLYPAFPAVREARAFDNVAAEWSIAEPLVTGSGTTTAASFVSAAYFDTIGVAISHGRGFRPEDDRRGAPLVAVLTDDCWRRAFNRNPAAIGSTMLLAGKPVTIVGVSARYFRGDDLTQRVDLFLPFHTIADVASPLMNYFAEPGHVSSPTMGTRLLLRLPTGMSPDAARARLAGLSVAGVGLFDADLVPLQTAVVPFGLRAGLAQFSRLLAATVSMLVLIGCATVATLLLVRSEARRDELAVCVALGASRGRLAAGILAEGVLLAAFGAVCAAPIAWWVLAGIQTFQLPGSIDIGALDLGLDAGTLVRIAATAAAAALVLSAIAATFALRPRSIEWLRARGGSTPRATRRRTRAVLVASEVAVALVLVAGAMLFARSLAAALALNSGVDMHKIVVAFIEVGPRGYDKVRAATFFDDVRQGLRGNPAVSSAAYSVEEGGMGGKLIVDGEGRQFPSMVRFTAVDSDYFRTMGLQIAGGRDFTGGDRRGAPLVCVVSRSFARALAPLGGAIGRRITMPFHPADRPPDVIEVVGIVDDLVTRVSQLQPLTMYLPLAQRDAGTGRSIALRARADSVAAQRELAAAIAHVDPSVSLFSTMTLDSAIARQMEPQRMAASVLGTMGAIALLLTGLATYVVAESMAVLRVREMGIRAALGASRRQIMGLVLSETARLLGGGIGVGLLLIYAAGGMVRALLFQVRPLDPATMTLVPLLMLALGFLASLRPALRAAHVDLAQVLKEQ